MLGIWLCQQEAFLCPNRHSKILAPCLWKWLLETILCLVCMCCFLILLSGCGLCGYHCPFALFIDGKDILDTLGRRNYPLKIWAYVCSPFRINVVAVTLPIPDPCWNLGSDPSVTSRPNACGLLFTPQEWPLDLQVAGVALQISSGAMCDAQG